MTSIFDLDDPNKTSVYITPQDDTDAASSSLALTHDLPGGHELRLEIFKDVWEKCLGHIRGVLRDLYAPTVSSVVSHIRLSHSPTQVLPGLPYAELPVVSLCAPGSSSQILSAIFDALETKKEHVPPRTKKGKGRMVEPDNNRVLADSYMAHLRPEDCNNLTSAMKAIITGFVDISYAEDDESDGDDLLPRSTKRKASTSLANYDINLLNAWYLALRASTGNDIQLVVFLHDFEQLDPSVMQDVFCICSQYASTLPLVFLLAVSSPSNPSFLHSTYPRSTLALLRTHTVVAPLGPAVVENILAQTFFSVEFDPDIMLGPATLEYLADFCARHTPSVDSMLDIIQLAFMKHFQDPFTLFAKDTLLGTKTLAQSAKKLERPESFDFLDSLLTRLWSDHSSSEKPLPDIDIDWRSPSVASLLSCVSSAHSSIRHRSRNMRLGFSVMRVVAQFMRGQGYKVSNTANGRDEYGLDLMCNVPRGRFGRDLKYLGLMVKKLSGRQIDGLLSELHGFFQSFTSPQLLREEEAARVKVVTAIAQLPREAVETEDNNEEVGVHPAVPPLATNIGDWLVEYVEYKISKLDQGLLWDVWNTGMTPFPSELLNPATRLTMVNALLHPHEVIATHKELFGNDPTELGAHVNTAFANPSTPGRQSVPSEPQKPPPLWHLPDTSILFRRYMDAGKLINVYDWYESFAVVLEAQRRELRKKPRPQNTNGVGGVSKPPQTPQTPKTPKRRRKGKERATEEVVESDEEEMEEEMDEGEVERWKTEVQARFMRSYHDLDFMGFIKHTGRKADHVIKTIYDLPD